MDVHSAQPAPKYTYDPEPLVTAPWSETPMKDLSAASTAHSTPSLATLVATANYSVSEGLKKVADPHDLNV